MSLQPHAPASALAFRLTLALAFAAVGCSESPEAPTAVVPGVVTRFAADASLAGGTSAGITVPATGSSNDGRTFRGTLTVTGAGFRPADRAGAVPPAAWRPDAWIVRPGCHPVRERIPQLRPGRAGFHGDEGHEDCIQLEIQPPTEFDPATKTTVQFDVSTLMMATLPGPANLLADLIRANDRAIAAAGAWSSRIRSRAGMPDDLIVRMRDGLQPRVRLASR